MTLFNSNLLLPVLIALGTASCSNGIERYEVSGTEYCVPDSLAVAAPYWVPADEANSLGSFAFSGCASDEQPCPLPNVVSGSVRGSSTSSVWRLKDFPKDAFYRQLAMAPDTEVKAVLSGNILVLQNTKMDPQWFVWRRSKHAGSIPLSQEDELQAVCGSGLANPDYFESTLQTVSCRRSVIQHGLHLQYSFQSQDKAPKDLPRLDASVFSAIQSWECRGSRSSNSSKPKPLRGSA